MLAMLASLPFSSFDLNHGANIVKGYALAIGVAFAMWIVWTWWRRKLKADAIEAQVRARQAFARFTHQMMLQPEVATPVAADASSQRARYQKYMELLLTTAGHCDCGTALGALERNAARLERRRRSSERKEATLRRGGWSEARIWRWREQQQNHRSGLHPQAGVSDWERLLTDMLRERHTAYVGLLVHWYGEGADEPIAPAGPGNPAAVRGEPRPAPGGRSRHLPGWQRGWGSRSAAASFGMNRPVAALPWLLLASEDAYEDITRLGEIRSLIPRTPSFPPAP